MDAENRLAEVFDAGLANGIASLSPRDQDLYRIQDFIIDFQMGGLSGYLYNHLPDVEDIERTVEAMRRRKLTHLASLLKSALNLFRDYVDPDPPSTWEDVLKEYDPGEKLQDVESRIHELDNFGLKSADIS
jgi:hypothetical protein